MPVETTMDRSTFYQRLREFLRETTPDAAESGIAPDENLIDGGYISSLRMVELILFIEELLGIEIPIEHFEARTFHTMERIYETFCAREVARG